MSALRCGWTGLSGESQPVDVFGVPSAMLGHGRNPFEKTRTPLRSWLAAVWYVTNQNTASVRWA